MEVDLYSSELLNWAEKISDFDHIENPDFVNEANSPVCGSRVKIELKTDLKTKKITDFGYEVEACALTKTVLSIMKHVIIGQSIQQVNDAGLKLQRLLDEDDSVLKEDWGVWKDLKIMQTAQDYTMRHHSIMLPFQTIYGTINM